ncbi:MAG: hypothetical protein ACOC8F_05610 [Planctomycetota bacterium]
MRWSTTTMRRRCVAVVIAALAGVAAAQQKGLSAYEKLDEVRLARVLGEVGMVEMLRGLREEMAEAGDETARLAAEAQLRLIAANRAEKPAARQEAIDQAVRLLRQAADEAPKEDAPAAEWVKHFRVRFLVARTLALRKARPLAQGVLYLTAGPDERRRLERITAEAMDTLHRLDNSVTDLLERWRSASGSERLRNIMKEPPVRRFGKEIAFHAAWVRFYRGVAIPDERAVAAARRMVRDARALVAGGDAAQTRPAEASPSGAAEKLRTALRILNAPVAPPEGRPVGPVQEACGVLRDLLEQIDGEDDLDWQFRGAETGLGNLLRVRRIRLRTAIDDVQPFVEDPRRGLKYWSLLLQGMAYRELGEHDAAREALGAIREAASRPEGPGKPGPEVVVDAMFQLARNEIERGKPDVARVADAIDLFMETAGRAADGDVDRRQWLEVRAAMLRVRLHQRLAELAREANEPDEARSQERQAAAALFAFTNERQRLSELEEPTEAQQQRLAWLREHGESMQVGLFTVLTRHAVAGDIPSGVDPVYGLALRLARVYAQLGQAESEQQRREVLAPLRRMLADEPAPDAEFDDPQRRKLTQRIYVAARWEMGRLLYDLMGPQRGELLDEYASLRRKLTEASVTADQLDATRKALSELRERLMAPAEQWYELARRYPDHPLAFQAAHSAAAALQAVVNAADIPDATAPFSEELGGTYREVLELLTTRWSDRAKARSWRGELAWLMDRLSAGDEPTLGRLRNILRAIPLLEETPPESPAYMTDWFSAINKRLELLRGAEAWRQVADVADKPRREALAERLDAYTGPEAEDALITMLGDFADKARTRLEAVEDADTRKRLEQRGSWAALTSAVMLYDRGERQSDPEDLDAALAKLGRIQKEWADTGAADQAELIEIQAMFQRQGEADMEQLLDRLERLLAERPAEASERLIGALYSVRDRVQSQVNRLRRQTQTASVRRDLQEYARRYVLFSRVIYEYQRKKKGPAADSEATYEALTTYADALLAAGRFDDERLAEAMETWQQAREADEVKRKRAREAIAGQVAAWLKRLQQARGDLDELRSLAKDCVEAFGANPDVTPLSGEPRRLAELYEKLDEPGVLATRIERACRKYKQQATDAVAADAMMLYGLARAHEQRENYAEAMKLYRRVVRGLAPDQPRPPKAPELGSYWDVQLRYCRARLRAESGDAERMSALATYLRQLGVQDADGFRQVYQEAQRRAR